ncbi:MAG: sugar phosphate nucleotidyltransferase [Desulfobacterium sp.]|jgi:aminoglycoside/choline kinase family phosphotransferase/dTDP-glucose pyrophosphorylase|nr:sugar phosphate nucleotidyltransferase [Desulfobacterium sp.]
MKALVLAAGFGTRLLPHTKKRPKPLFTLAGDAILGITIKRLIEIGCRDIIVNTHHLYRQIETYISQAGFPIPVHTIHEPKILDTGGAIKNVKDFMGASHFMVINSDIATDIDLEPVWQFHLRGNWPVTLVLHDRTEFNGVEVDDRGFVCGFSPKDYLRNNLPKNKRLAFTGIQVLAPEIFDHMPEENVFSSIDLYARLAKSGSQVKAHVVTDHLWEDIGTVPAYERTGIQYLALAAFKRSNLEQSSLEDSEIKQWGQKINPMDLVIQPISGDGSDRRWFRALFKDKSIVICAHGLSSDTGICEIDSFMALGDLLYSQKIPVPKILARDRFSGLVALEDLGDIHFSSIVASQASSAKRVQLYCRVVDLLIEFSMKGGLKFKPEMAYQTNSYSRKMILERECLYFAESFLKNFLDQDPPISQLLPEFNHLAERALAGGVMGLMHRDLQSRNLMVNNDKIFFIDFQSARMGPIQYDLASLLIDPYVNLDADEKDEILAHGIVAISSRVSIDKESFLSSFRHCCITRNLQILGAFSYLGMVKKKRQFIEYIPSAISSLKQGLGHIDKQEIPTLNALVERF